MKLFGMETKQERATRLEAERVEKSNRQREIETLRGLVAQQDLDLHCTRERINELKKEIAELEEQATKRDRKLAHSRARLAVMESAA